MWLKGGSNIKKRTKLILIVLLVIIAAVALLAYNFRSYINAFIIARTASPEEIEQMRNDTSAEKVLAGYENINIRDLTEEEQQKLVNNEMTEEEAIELMLGMMEFPPALLPPSGQTSQENVTYEEPLDIPAPPSPDIPAPPSAETPVQDTPVTVTPPAYTTEPDLTTAPTVTTPPSQVQTPVTDPPKVNEQKPSDDNGAANETNEMVARLVAQLYVAKTQANNRLTTMEAEWKAEYLKVPAKQRKETNLLATYIKSAVKVVSAWEAETDAQVEGILTEIHILLKDSGQNTDLVTTLRQAYEDEKTYIKAYYLNKIGKWT